MDTANAKARPKTRQQRKGPTQAGATNYFDVALLCNEAVERNFRGGSNSVGSVVSQATYHLIWSTFVKWCQGEFQVGRAVTVPQFGVIGYQALRDNLRIPYVRLSEIFLGSHNLSYKPEFADFESQADNVVTEPMTKPNFPAMSKAAQVDNKLFQTVLMNMFHVIGELLSESNMAEIDLKDMGKFFANNGQVLYDPLNKLKPQAPQGKQTVKSLMDYGVSGPGPAQTQQYFTHQQQNRSDLMMDQFYRPQGSDAGLDPLPRPSRAPGQAGYRPKTAALPGVRGQPPARRYKKPYGDAKITKDLLGAGDDPMAKNQEFSLLANNPSALMRQTFKKPGTAVSRYPPVIDPFSRTLAAPISSEKHYFSVCHKIGTNFTPTTKGLYVDSKTRTVRFKPMGEKSGTKLDSAGSGGAAAVEPADEQEEYEALIYPQNADPKRIKARKVSYTRYRQYVENEISVDVIAPIRQYWLTHIIELIPGDLHAVEKERIEYLIDTMLNEINKDYFDSVRKSILDYILKNEDEMRRLNIQQVLNQPVDWGDDFYKGIEPNEEWKHNVMMARMLMSENLCICSQATLELMKLWREFKDYLFVNIPAPREEPLPLLDFLSNQEAQSVKVKGLLMNDWNRAAVEILREELENLDKDQAKTFFESASTLMANQVRELIEQSIKAYVDFIQRYKFPEYPKPDEIIYREYDADSPFEDNFISLKLTIEDTNIAFGEPLEMVQQDLEQIIDRIVEQSTNLPRPENTISRADKQHLWDVQLDDEVVQKAKAAISQTLRENLEVIQLALNVYNDYLFILKEKERVEEFLRTGPFEREVLQAEINKYQDTITKIREEMPFEIRCNMFLIICSDINNTLCDACEMLMKMILDEVSSRLFGTKAQNIYRDIKEIREDLSNKAQNSELLVNFEAKLETVRTKERNRLTEEYNDVIEWLMMLHRNPRYKLVDENLKPITTAYDNIRQIAQIIEVSENKLKQERTDIENALEEQKRVFHRDLTDVEGQIGEFKDQRTLQKRAKQYCEEILTINATLKRLTQEMNHIHEQQADLDQVLNEYPVLAELKTKIKPFEELWNLRSEFEERMRSWQSDQLKTLDPDQVEGDFKRMYGQANKLQNRFEKVMPKPQHVATQMKTRLHEFRPSLGIIRALCNPALSSPDMDNTNTAEVFALIGMTQDEGQTIADLKLDTLTMYKVGEKAKREKLEEISERASKEFSNHKIMVKMKEDWEPLRYTCVEVEGKDSYILSGEAVEEIQTALDDHIIKTQTMRGSPFAKFMLEKILKWEDLLNRTQDNLDLWLKVQASWMYLEPVFSSEDIISQMPVEGKKFRLVNASWKALMERIKRDERALTVIDIMELGAILKKANANLEEVNKGLNEYLESKRSLFPRFFFLSNDELLEILSETKEPLRVQPHLKKCFEGIAKLKFDDERKIHGMYSIEGELVPYTRVIDPIASKGQVEDWLVQVEEVMLRSVKQIVESAYQDYAKRERATWITAWQGQGILCVSVAYWTMQTEEAMKKNGLQGLIQHYDRLMAQLNDTVGVVRTDISKLQRATLEALIVLDVHAKDVVQQELIDKEICDPTDFGWLAQLRYSWEDNNIWTRIINCKLDYNYEYLGNSPRLVITQLTDRCYRTLCSAIFLNYGGAPEGPAGTGKTETVKDLSKALARQCIVFNCSDGLDYKIMGKFFKGLSSCGAWSCFDEFNRIELEVLSVIAQQVQTIQRAIDNKVERFIFEDVEIPIKRTCNCFITMNPGYAGRSELPDNLKALFRSVAMMVPDYTLIAEISLYSYGFTDAKNLALKITTTYKLCSEQLSSQCHYDYGMRAVKSVLTAAGNLKRRFIRENESILMLRAINDVNLAKFLAHDLPLFRNITSDLFPGVVLPEPDYKDLERCMKLTMDKMNLQYHPYFMMKTIQLYEMILVRHGLMIVGLPFSGKTGCIKVLQGALSQLKEEGLMEECKTHISIVNPKSITMGQLYGNFDEVSHDWSDGVLAVNFRYMAAGMSGSDRRWLVFDGPVDALWIENMNTVLDDNKKLCLMSGEVIQMGQNMNMIFEPMDLAVASPATVSRCGMVYLQPHEMGWDNLYKSWKNKLPERFDADQTKVCDHLVYIIVQPCIDYVRRQAKETTPTEDQNLVVSMLRIWRALLKFFDEEANFASLDKKRIAPIIEHCFLFAAIWSLGVSIDTEYRRPFDQYFKKICNGEIEGMPKLKHKVLPSAFDRGTIYDYCYLPETNEWKNWIEFTNKEEIDQFPKGSVVSEIIVTTVDTIRYGYMQELFVMNDIRSLFVGPTGTGKTAYTQNILNNKLSVEKWLVIEVGFSAQTHCNQVQDIIDMKLDKRRKDHFGPRFGMRCVVFVDDLNMPKKEKYGAQPPVEILRQFLDQGGWYDRKDNKHPFRNLVDTMLVTAMGTPGGGRQFITPRFQRHFNIVAFANFDEATLNTIFRSILKFYFRTGGFTPDVAGMEQKIVAATLRVYDQIQKDLRPTPMKTHYTFNLRDFSKVICGMCMVTKKEVTNTETVLRLWAHECTRIFGDRLINNTDRMWMLNMVKECTARPFGQSFDSIFRHLDTDKNGKVETLDEFRGLLFGDIYAQYGVMERPYEEILDKEKLQQCAADALFNYNSISDKPMPLVLFNFAIEHLLRIGRILKQSGGHALLVGVGGSGRQSQSFLASKITDYEPFQIEIKKNYRMVEWREDLKQLMGQAGTKGQPTSFVLTDNHIKMESFLEDVNNILNTGEVPNIFPADEKADVCESVRKPAKEENRCPEGTPQQLFSFFVERCKKNLHIVLCFSPIGAALRNRIRDFPSIVTCTTIDWFSEWPPDALEAVAQKFLQEVAMTDEVRQCCVSMVQTFHTSTERGAKKFKDLLRRIYYVTPTSYLELINTFKTLLAEQRDRVSALKSRYSNGYDCLITTEQRVNIMKKELEDLEPILIATDQETQEKLVIVTQENEAAIKVKTAVAAEEADASVIADEANAIKQDCEQQLAEAIPALKAAEDAVNCITKADIAVLKGLAKPPADVKNVTSVVCMFFGIKPDVKMNPETQKKEKDYWIPSIKMMMDAQFLKKLIDYDKEGIQQELVDTIHPIITQDNFQAERLKNVSAVAMNLAKWVHAMDKFYKVNKVVKPKKEQLAVAEKKYAAVMEVLKVKQAELQKIVDKVNALQLDLKITQDKKASLEAQVADCQAKLIRAESLIKGLGGEKTRWKAESERLAIVYENLTGDVLISSGMIAYLGAFTQVFRSDLAEEWVKLCEAKDIPNSGQFSLERVLGDPVKIRNWGLFGLPNDSFSIENAIITDNTRRWPLFIDPQGQANRWLKNMEKENSLKLLKFTDGNYLKHLEASIRTGAPVLIENVGEELDPAIEPLLQKQIVVKGGSMTLKLGDAVIEYAKEFKFYMTTKLRNPHYLPEVSTKVTLINFMITFEGLSDQLLGIVVEKENPELQTMKEQIVVEGAKNKNKLQEIEDQILHTLQNSKDILADAKGIEILQNANVLNEQIKVRQAEAEKTELKIDEARTGYQPISQRTSGLFFCITDLANIDPMYQYSLDFFKALFVTAIANSEPSNEIEERVGFLNKEFLESLYRNICRSLFEKDKLVFSCMLACKLMEMAKELDPIEFRFFLTGGVAIKEDYGDPPADWVSEKMWGEMNRLDKLRAFKGWAEHVRENHEHYKKMYESSAPQDCELLGRFRLLDRFQFMCIQRTIRPDMIVPAISNFVVDKIGEPFVTPPTFDLSLVFKDSSAALPLVFVLSPGADPLNSLEKYAETKKKQVFKVSLGQGQGPIAEKYIADGVKLGNWVVLQNCHLAVSWMGTLEKICEDLPQRKPHREFRLWLTSYPTVHFPVAVLQNGVKMTNEPPMGLKQNLYGSFATDPISNRTWFEGCLFPKPFRKMLFGLCFFHAFIQERRSFGPLGWNIQYQFNESDLRISAQQLPIFIDENPEKVPLPALNYLTGECNYGGRVTEDKDRRLLKVILKKFYCADIYDDNDYKFSPSGLYYAPRHTDVEGYLEYIKALPQFPDPEVYGFHENAAITKNQNATNLALNTILLTQQNAGGGGGGGDDALINKLADSILAELPPLFDVDAAEAKYPISYEQSMNTVLTQELTRFNNLVKVIRTSLVDLKKAIKGEVLLSAALEAALGSLKDGTVPQMWLDKSYPSLKNLAGYNKDLLDRLQWFTEWLEGGIPAILWITRFYFTQGFLTGAKQNFARKYNIAIDLLDYDFIVQQDQENPTRPEDGVNVSGMYLEGCRWDHDSFALAESEPKVLYTRCPIVWIRPCKTEDFTQGDFYECPVYKTSVRKGTLATTGHSTNFVIMLLLPTAAPADHWILRGAAILCSLDD